MSKKKIHDDSFILASQAIQVFYCKNNKFNGWSNVLHSPMRLTKEINAIEIEHMMYDYILKENEELLELLDTELI